jgi:chemotaxis protein CheD
MKRALPAGCVEVFLGPGEYYFGDRDTCVRTLLGSCVAVTMWHPRERLGGMCHFLLPERSRKAGELDPRYGKEAISMLMEAAARADTDPADYQFKVFGGGNMFPELATGTQHDVGRKNVALALRLLRATGYPVVAQHVGGWGHRNVVLDVWSGDDWLQHLRSR